MDMIQVNKFIRSLKNHNELLLSESERLEGLYNARADIAENIDENEVHITIYIPKYDTYQYCNISRLNLKAAISRDISDTEAYLKDCVRRIKAGAVEGVI